MSTKKSLSSLLVLACLLLNGQQRAVALSVERASFTVVEAEADLVIAGVVKGTRVVCPHSVGPETQRGRAWTVVEVRVDAVSPRSRRQVAEGSVVSFWLPGGSCNGRTTVVAGLAIPRVETPLLLLLEDRGGAWMPIGYTLGMQPLVALQGVAGPSGAGPLNAYLHLLAASGEPARWENPCITWHLDVSGSRDLPRVRVEEALEQAFAVWTAVDGAYPVFGSGGATCAGEPGIEPLLKRNVVMFRDGEGAWPHASRVVGLTSTTIDDTSGFIVDADIELNGEFETFSDDGDPQSFDLQQIATHEIGHMLGLDHTTDISAVMHESTEKGERDNLSLHPDDVAGLLASHGDELLQGAVDCTFGPPAAVEAPLCPVADEDGCDASGGGGSGDWFLALLLCCALAGVRRRDGVRQMHA